MKAAVALLGLLLSICVFDCGRGVKPKLAVFSHFQACSIHHSDISPFRINNLRAV